MNPGRMFVDWLLIGIQSFGGGSSTFSLIHQAAVQRGWLSEDEFVRAWALAQIAPGINLVKLTVMIGYRLNGWLGVLAAMSGLLLPSAAVTEFRPPQAAPLERQRLGGLLDGFSPPAKRAHNGLTRTT